VVSAAAAVVAVVAADMEPDTRTAADVQMVLAVLQPRVTLRRSTLLTSRRTLLEQQQRSLNQYQRFRGPIRLRTKAEGFTGRWAANVRRIISGKSSPSC